MKKLTKILLFAGLTLGIIVATSVTTAILVTRNKSINKSNEIAINKLSIFDNTNSSLNITVSYVLNKSKTTINQNNLSICFDSITIDFSNLVTPILLNPKNLTLRLSFLINDESANITISLPDNNSNPIILSQHEQCVIVGLELSLQIQFDPLKALQLTTVSYKEIIKK